MNCERCGQLRVPGATFCTGCGAPLETIRPVDIKIDEQVAGASCPYCHTALIAGQEGSACPHCSAIHHRECWNANGGCGTAGCSAGPIGKAVVAGGPGATESTASNGKRAQYLILGLVATAVVIVGIVTAVFVTSGDPPLLSETLASSGAESLKATTTQAPGSTGASGKSKRKARGSGDPYTASDQVIKREIKLMMRRHYGAVNRGDWNRAYKTLSPRKRSQKRAEAVRGGLASGTDKYQQQFAGELMGQLDMSGLKVDVEDVDPDASEASFVLTIPKRNGGCYSGLTWAAYDKRRGWLFDIGSAGRAERPTSGAQVLQSRSAPC